jgi:chitinase
MGMIVAGLSALPLLGQSANQNEMMGAFFEESSIYYANFNIANLQQNGVANRLTHLFYAFAKVNDSGACELSDAVAAYQDKNLPSVSGAPYSGPLYGNFAALQQLEQLHPNLHVLISIGGSSASNATNFSAAASTSAGRQALASSCINMFIKGNIASGITAPGLFQGIHLDWEFPSSTDTANFTALLQEFRTQLNQLSASTGSQYYLSFYGPAGLSNIANINLSQAAAVVDFITVQGYVYAGGFDTLTNDASSLYDDEQDPESSKDLPMDVNDTETAYLAAGVPAAKYVLGVPLYGYGWTGVPNLNQGLYQTQSGPAPVLLADGTGLCPDPSGDPPSTGCDPYLEAGYATYATLENLPANGYTLNYDSQRVAAWLYNPTPGTFYTFDDPQTAKAKMQYVLTQGLGGAFVWSLKGDDASGTMVKTMASALSGSGPPVINPNGVVSASSFGEFSSVAPGSWIEIYGSNLAIDSRSWTTSDFSGENAPTSLDGTAVTIGGQAAFIDFISPVQVNALVPSNVATGIQPLTVTVGSVASAPYNVMVNAVQPGLDAPPSFDIGGIQYAVALFADGEYVLPQGAIAGLNSRPAQPGDEIVLYGVGFGPVTPGTPAGQIVQQSNTLASAFDAFIGGVPANAVYSGLAPGYTGLYQFNLKVPANPGSGDVPLTFTVGGTAGTQTLHLAVGN